MESPLPTLESVAFPSYQPSHVLESEGLINAIPSILIGLDNAHVINRWNATAERVFGFSASTVVGKSFESCGIMWNWETVQTSVTSCEQSLESIRVPEIRYVIDSEREGFLGLTVSPILREDGTKQGLLILGSDITERKRFEAQLVIAQKMESIGQLAAGVAHELNTPIHYVAENVRFLRDNFEDVQQLLKSFEPLLQAYKLTGNHPDTVEVFENVLKEMDLEYLIEEIPNVISQTLEGTERVTEIVKAMKELSHPGTGDKVAVDIARAIHSAITVSTKEWKEIADIKTELDPNLSHVPGYSGEFNQVLLNLVVNAAHAIKEKLQRGDSGKGTITIRTQLRDNWAEIRISDTGIGMPDNIRSKIFDPFFTTKEVGRGTGQGLALAHSIIVQKHGGILTFESEVGKGTTFLVGLPMDSNDRNQKEGKHA